MNLNAEHVSVLRGRTEIVHDVSFSVSDGQWLMICGPNGAGKSTLLNQLTGAGIPANNRLFDTLDTTSRLLTVSDNLDVILSDTVGFIAKLPHHLVDAFRATLEELEFADFPLTVAIACDGSNLFDR